MGIGEVYMADTIQFYLNFEGRGEPQLTSDPGREDMTGSKWSQCPHFGGNRVCVYMCVGECVGMCPHTQVCESWLSTLRVTRTHIVQPIPWLLNQSFCWNQMVLRQPFFFFQNPSFNDWKVWNIEQCNVSSNVVIGPHISWHPVSLFPSCCLSAQLCEQWGQHSHRHRKTLPKPTSSKCGQHRPKPSAGHYALSNYLQPHFFLAREPSLSSSGLCPSTWQLGAALSLLIDWMDGWDATPSSSSHINPH